MIPASPADVLRQEKDIEGAIKSVSSWASKTLGEVWRHRAGTLLHVLCHTDKFCRLRFIVGIIASFSTACARPVDSSMNKMAKLAE